MTTRRRTTRRPTTSDRATRRSLLAAVATAPLLLAPLVVASSASAALIPKPWPPEGDRAPVVTVEPAWRFQIGAQVDQTAATRTDNYDLRVYHQRVPVELVWSARSRVGIAGYDLYRHDPKGGDTLYQLLAGTTQTRYATSHTDASHVFGPITRELYPTFKLVATDNAGRSTTVDPIRRSPEFSEQENGTTWYGESVFPTDPVVVRHSWQVRTGGDYDAGAVLVARSHGATLRIPVTAGHDGQWFALEMTTGPRLGRVEVRVDGHTVGLVDTHAATRTPRVLVAQYKVSQGAHTITLVDEGTGYRPSVELDGIFASD